MNAYSQYTDEELFQFIAGGSEHAFHAFFSRYNTKLFYFILYIVRLETDAEELTQDVFVKLWANRSRLADITNPGNYLFVIARNSALDQLDKQSTQKRLKIAVATNDLLSNITEDEVLYRDSKKLIALAVEQLPGMQKSVYQLSKNAGLSRYEIAERLNISPNTVKNHLGTAIKSIRQYLERHGQFGVIYLLLHIF
ncbi:RNA polymerase sigma-70 factor [Flavitalea sp.]|nr:RNA polymerase sigma-70 factor [Flavitalea sp.]